MTTLAIVGAGPGLGLATARTFGAEGFNVGLIARRHDRLDDLVRDLTGAGITAAGVAADARDPDATAAALDQIADRLGPVEALLHSPLPSVEWIKPVTETTPSDLRASLELSVLGAAAAVAAVLPGMRQRRRGTLLFTTGGAAVSPKAARAGSGITYAAEVAYARMLHDTLAADGIHVAHIAIVGPLGPGRTHEPAKIAELLWRHHRDRHTFQTIAT
jgi:NADP-dependent 3-hydroxy acid dehydrogenase YdfG